MQTKLTASLLQMCLELPSKMINRASIFHKGLTFESTSGQKAFVAREGWRAPGSQDTCVHTDTSCQGPVTPCAIPLGTPLGPQCLWNPFCIIIKVFTWGRYSFKWWGWLVHSKCRDSEDKQIWSEDCCIKLSAQSPGPHVQKQGPKCNACVSSEKGAKEGSEFKERKSIFF